MTRRPTWKTRRNLSPCCRFARRPGRSIRSNTADPASPRFSRRAFRTSSRLGWMSLHQRPSTGRWLRSERWIGRSSRPIRLPAESRPRTRRPCSGSRTTSSYGCGRKETAVGSTSDRCPGSEAGTSARTRNGSAHIYIGSPRLEPGSAALGHVYLQVRGEVAERPRRRFVERRFYSRVLRARRRGQGTSAAGAVGRQNLIADPAALVLANDR